MQYIVTIDHDDDGELNVSITHAGSSDTDRETIGWALREAAFLVENGLPIDKEKLN